MALFIISCGSNKKEGGGGSTPTDNDGGRENFSQRTYFGKWTNTQSGTVSEFCKAPQNNTVNIKSSSDTDCLDAIANEKIMRLACHQTQT